MRRETVVVHGEVLVIRKLVVAGIVAAEKAYLDCLNVIKEVSISLMCVIAFCIFNES